MGALDRRADGEPPLLSRAGLLPLATCEPVLARGRDHRPRRLRPADGRRRRAALAGAHHLRDGATCRRRSLTGLPSAAARSIAGSASAIRSDDPPDAPHRSRPAARRSGERREASGGAPPDLRAVRERAGGASAHSASCMDLGTGVQDARERLSGIGGSLHGGHGDAERRVANPMGFERARRAPRNAFFLLAAGFLFSGRPALASCGSGDPWGRPRIGVALSGGGARGLAHIGVLRVLEGLRVPIDCIAGTSMGSIVGGLYATGLSPDEVEAEMKRIDWIDLFDDRPPRPDLSYRRKQDDVSDFIDLELGIRNGRLTLPRGLIAGQKIDFLLQSL